MWIPCQCLLRSLCVRMEINAYTAFVKRANIPSRSISRYVEAHPLLWALGEIFLRQLGQLA